MPKLKRLRTTEIGVLPAASTGMIEAPDSNSGPSTVPAPKPVKIFKCSQRSTSNSEEGSGADEGHSDYEEWEAKIRDGPPQPGNIIIIVISFCSHF